MKSAVLTARQDLTARAAVSLALLGLPLSAVLTVGLGLGLMAWAGCTHLSSTWVTVGASVFVLGIGALAAGMIGNVLRTRRAWRLAESASVPLDDPARLETLERLANRLDAPVPELRAIPLDSPLAFGVLGPRPALVVSTWVFETLSDAEWEALIVHELAHMRDDDRVMRWLGSGFFEAIKGVPGARGAWDRLEAAMEDAADQAVLSALGTNSSLVSARGKFLAAQGTDDQGWHQVLSRPSLSYQLALASIGVVATLPLLPFVIVPLCVSICGI